MNHDQLTALLQSLAAVASTVAVVGGTLALRALPAILAGVTALTKAIQAAQAPDSDGGTSITRGEVNAAAIQTALASLEAALLLLPTNSVALAHPPVIDALAAIKKEVAK